MLESRLKPSALPIIIDVEASGFGAGSYPIEIGVVLACGTPHCYLLQPFPDWTHWDQKAQMIHGIERSVLEQRGVKPLVVARELNGLLRGKVVYSDGWGVDNGWIAQLYDKVGLRQAFQIETLRRIISEPQVAFWRKTKDEVIKELGLRRHRASSDALILQKTCERVWARCRDRSSGTRADSGRRPGAA